MPVAGAGGLYYWEEVEPLDDDDGDGAPTAHRLGHDAGVQRWVVDKLLLAARVMWRRVVLSRGATSTWAPWGLRFEEGTLRLSSCGAGSPAGASAAARGCVGMALTRVDRRP
eukprot:gene475-7901_t